MLRIAAITTVSGALLGLTLAAGCDQTEYGEPVVDENETVTPAPTDEYGDTDLDDTDLGDPDLDTDVDDADDTILDDEDRSAATPPEAETTLIGVLEQSDAAGAAAGWVLTGTNAGNVEVDVTNVTEDITALEGQRVLVTGELVERNDDAGGLMQVLVADRIEAA